MSAQEQKRRPDALDDLRGILDRCPDAIVRVSDVYPLPGPERDGWFRVSVTVDAPDGKPWHALRPRFKAFDDATSFRVRAERMITDGS